MSIDYRTLLTYELIGRKEVAAKSSHRPENVLALYQDANSAGCMADAVLAARIPGLCPDCKGSGWAGCTIHTAENGWEPHRHHCQSPCDHRNAPTIADLLRWGEEVARERNEL